MVLSFNTELSIEFVKRLNVSVISQNFEVYFFLTRVIWDYENRLKRFPSLSPFNL